MRTVTSRVVYVALTSLVLFGVVACASGGEPGESGQAVPPPPEGSVNIEIYNNLRPSATVTIWVVPRGGDRLILGTVEPFERRVLTFGPVRANLEYRLHAAGTGGTPPESAPFFLDNVEHIRWDVNGSRVRVIRDQ